MLSGIALVVEDAQKGQKLAFRYPGPRVLAERWESPQPSRVHHHQQLQQQQHRRRRNSADENLHSDGAAPWRKVRRNSAKQQQQQQQQEQQQQQQQRQKKSKRALQVKDFWRFEAEMLAKIFRPTQAQCGKMFQLQIDNLLFLSFPVQISRSEAALEPAGEFANAAEVNANTQGNNNIAATNAPISLPQTSKNGVAMAMAGNASSTAQETAVTSDAIASKGTPAENTAPQESASRHQDLTMFSLIFVLDNDCERFLEESRYKLGVSPGYGMYGLPYPGSRESIEMYRRAAMKLAAGMLSEEHRCGYISEQVHIMLSAIKYQLETSARLEETSGTNPVDSSRRDLPNATENLEHQHHRLEDDTSTQLKWKRVAVLEAGCQAMLAALRRSELAQELRRAFYGLSENGTVDFLLNDFVRLSFSLQNPILHPVLPLRPYQTILLYDKFLDEPVSSQFDSSSQLASLVSYSVRFGPRKSFEDMSLALHIPLHEVFRLAAHLMYWRKGRVVDVVQPRNIYRVSPSAELDPTSTIHFEFQSKFGRWIIPPSTSETSTLSSTSTFFPIKAANSFESFTTDGMGSQQDESEKQQYISNRTDQNVGDEEDEDDEDHGWRLASLTPPISGNRNASTERNESDEDEERTQNDEVDTGEEDQDQDGGEIESDEEDADTTNSNGQRLRMSSSDGSSDSTSEVEGTEKGQGKKNDKQKLQKEITAEERRGIDHKWMAGFSRITLSLSKVLELFSTPSGAGKPMTLEEQYSHAKKYLNMDATEFNEVLDWLLRHELLVQLHRYFYMIVPNQRNLVGPKKVRAGDTQPFGYYSSSRADVAAAAAQAADQRVAEQAQAAEAQAVQAVQLAHNWQAVHADQSSLRPSSSSSGGSATGVMSSSLGSSGQQTATPNGDSDHCALLERPHLQGMAASISAGSSSQQQRPQQRAEAGFLDYIANDSEVYRLFRRLTPYFHGRHHATEIVWRESISYETLDKVVQSYAEVLFSYLHS